MGEGGGRVERGEGEKREGEERGREGGEESERKTVHISTYLPPLCRELTQSGGELSNQIVATVCIPVIATNLHTHTGKIKMSPCGSIVTKSPTYQPRPLAPPSPLLAA